MNIRIIIAAAVSVIALIATALFVTNQPGDEMAGYDGLPVVISNGFTEPGTYVSEDGSVSEMEEGIIYINELPSS